MILYFIGPIYNQQNWNLWPIWVL